MRDSTLQASLADVPGGESLGKIIQDPNAAKARFLSYIPRAMFLMVPLLGLFFWLAYFRQKKP